MLLNQSSRRKLGFMSFATYCTYVLAELMDLYAYAGPVAVPGDLGVSLARPLKVGGCGVCPVKVASFSMACASFLRPSRVLWWRYIWYE